MNSIRQHIEFEALEMLHDIQKKLGIDKTTNAELEKIKETLDIGQLHKKLSELDKIVYTYILLQSGCGENDK